MVGGGDGEVNGAASDYFVTAGSGLIGGGEASSLLGRGCLGFYRGPQPRTIPVRTRIIEPRAAALELPLLVYKVWLFFSFFSVLSSDRGGRFSDHFLLQASTIRRISCDCKQERIYRSTLTKALPVRSPEFLISSRTWERLSLI